MNLIKVSNRIPFEKIILFVSIIAIVGFYYEKYLPLIKLAYVLLFFGFIRKLLIRRTLTFLPYITISLIFIFFAYISSLWALDDEVTINYVTNALNGILISILIINLCDSKDKVDIALVSLALAGLIFGLLYMMNYDVSTFEATRISAMDADLEGLPNVNVVGMHVSFSFAFFLFTYSLKKNKIWLILALISVIIIVLLGSRKTIINAALAILFLVWKTDFKNRLVIILFILSLIWIISIYVPQDYATFVIERFFELSSMNESEGDKERLDLLSSGFNYISENPLLGHGYRNFEMLYLREKGVLRYSHNNYIETFVGVGVLGFCLFYSLYFLILKKLKFKGKKFSYDTMLIALALLSLFDHFAIVVTDLKFTWIFIAILFAAAQIQNTSLISKNKNNENRIFGC